MVFSSSSLLAGLKLCVLFILINFVSSNSDLATDNPLVKLSVSPSAGYSAENVEVRCELAPSVSVSSLASSKFDNVYLSVKTDGVKPSGILLMFHDSTDGCQLNRENVRIDVCNATLISIHITHTILNETLQKIEYSCSKGSTYAHASYKLIKDRSARYFDPLNNSSCLLTSPTLVLLFFAFFIVKVQWL